MKNGKKVNVYILGAGASKDDGAPLTCEFLEYAFSHIDEINQDFSRYENLSRTLDSLFGTHYHEDVRLAKRGNYIVESYSSREILNIENILNELYDAVKKNKTYRNIKCRKKIEDIKDDLIYLIFNTLGREIGSRPSIESYLNFVNKILLTGKIHVIVSLNYDVLLENALCDPEKFFCNKYQNIIFNIDSNKDKKSPWSYNLDFVDIRGYEPCYSCKSSFVILIKLHGSLNWSYCTKCEGLILEHTNNYSAYKDIIDGKIRCKFCSSITEPFLVPPIKYKELNHPILKEMCEKSKYWLSVADTISVIGYSLPESDTHIKELLENGTKNNNEYSLTIVNKSYEDISKTNKLLSNNSIETNIFCTFSEYLESSNMITNR